MVPKEALPKETLNDKEMREVFHLVFLENLLRLSDRKLYVLKGGVNLRFFLKSPRYSEDMDLDVIGGSVETLKKNGYKVLMSDSFRRVLATYGIANIIVNDPGKAKQTETTQRFKARLVNRAGEEFPTKVEFSRRDSKGTWVEENIDPAISARYKRLAFRVQHYTGEDATQQKIRALAGRAETQARDVFDLYLLYLGGHWEESRIQVESTVLAEAGERVISISYEQYRDQVEAYLSDEGKGDFGGKKRWNEIQNLVVERLT